MVYIIRLAVLKPFWDDLLVRASFLNCSSVSSVVQLPPSRLHIMISPELREALLKLPAQLAPKGVTANFENPSNLYELMRNILIGGVVTATFLVAIKLYTQIWIIRKVHMEDYFFVLAWVSLVIRVRWRFRKLTLKHRPYSFLPFNQLPSYLVVFLSECTNGTLIWVLSFNTFLYETQILIVKEHYLTWI